MVKKRLPAALLALLLPALGLLGSCGFFTSSLFPGYLPQAEIGVDLSGQADALLAGRSNPLRGNVFLLEGFGCLLLTVDYAGDRELIALTPAGSLLEFPGSAIPDPGLGELHLLDAAGNFVVGAAYFNPGSFAYAGVTAINGEDTWKPGFSDGSSNFVFERGWGPTLTYYIYGSGWSGRTSRTASWDTGGYNYEVANVFHDPLAAGREVILVLRGDGDQAYVLRVPQADVSAGLSPPVIDFYGATALQDVDGSRVFYTRKGLVAADWDGRAVLYDYSGNETGKTLALGHSGQVQLAFSLAGDTFLAYEEDDRRLYRGRTGW